MGVTTFTDEHKSPVAPARLFKALFADSHNLVPKILPQSVKSIDLVHGDAGATGSIKQTNLVEGGHLKHRLDAVDADNFVCKYTLIEGDELGDKLDSVAYEFKLEAAGAGCVCKVTSHCHTKGDIVLKEEDIKEGKEKAMGLYKAVEDYLIANPAVYA